MQPGERIVVTARKADGHAYRWWECRVMEATADQVVTENAPGDWVRQPDGDWQARVGIRSYYWAGRPYVLTEVYEPDGTPSQLYVHITSPSEFSPDGVNYHDYELDVVKWVGRPARVLDEDEFEAAVATYGYTPAFQADCRRAVQEAIDLVEGWAWPGATAR